MLWRIIIFWLPVSYVVPLILMLFLDEFLQKEKYGPGLERYGIDFNEIPGSLIYWITCTIIFVLLVFFFEFRKKNK